MRTEVRPPSETAARLPETTGREPLPDGVRVRLRVPSTLAWFAGHFPGNPVVPGVAQIGWAIDCAREHFGQARDPAGIDRVKFLQTVPLDTPLALELRGGAARVDWRLLAGDELLGSGRLLF